MITFGIILSVLAVLTLMVYLGWQMGLSETSCLMLSIAMSFDYIVLYATEYIHSKQDTRFLRMEQANKIMAVSATYSMVTVLSFCGIIIGSNLVVM